MKSCLKAKSKEISIEEFHTQEADIFFNIKKDKESIEKAINDIKLQKTWR